MSRPEAVAERFSEEGPRLRAMAYRMLGSLAEAEDAVQETWLRLDAAAGVEIENLPAWLTTALARVCLNMLRSRRRRGEDPLEAHIPDPVVSAADGSDPEQAAILGDAVGLALMVVLESLEPSERLAFVLHDMFSVSFDEIAPLVEKSPAATRQLASRARRRVKDRAPSPDRDPVRQRTAVEAFFAAAREGDFDALVAVLHPDVVLRSEGGILRPRQTVVLSGAETVASQAVTFGQLTPYAHPVLVNGAAGVAVIAAGRPLSVMAFTVHADRIVAIDVLADPERLDGLSLTRFGPEPDRRP